MTGMDTTDLDHECPDCGEPTRHAEGPCDECRGTFTIYCPRCLRTDLVGLYRTGDNYLVTRPHKGPDGAWCHPRGGCSTLDAVEMEVSN